MPKFYLCLGSTDTTCSCLLVLSDILVLRPSLIRLRLLLLDPQQIPLEPRAIARPPRRSQAKCYTPMAVCRRLSMLHLKFVSGAIIPFHLFDVDNEIANAGGNAPSTQPAFAVPDSDDNPFLVGSSSQPPPQRVPAATQEATLRTIAAPVLARSCSRPHSPTRQHPQPVQAQPENQEEDDSADSESSSGSPSEDGSENAGRPCRGAWDLWKFFSELKVVGKTKKRTCLLCM